MSAPEREVVHACPPQGSGLMPCCGQTPFEVPTTDRVTNDPALVTCATPAPSSGCGEECADGHTGVTRCVQAGEEERCGDTGPCNGGPCPLIPGSSAAAAPAGLLPQYAEAIRDRIKAAVILPPTPGMIGQPFAATEYDLADAVLAVRDDDLARLRYEGVIARQDAHQARAEAQEQRQRAEQAEAELGDLQHNLALRAFTAPDADADTILTSLDARIADAVQRAERAEAAIERVRELVDECEARGHSAGHPLTVTRIREALHGTAEPAQPSADNDEPEADR